MSEPHSPEHQITDAPAASHGVTHAPAEGNTHGSHAAHPGPFSDAEVQQLQTSDVLAGKLVVCLMAGIFSVGLVLYTIIMIAVAT